MNPRTDEYGGSLENRMRYVTRVIRRIKELCGADYPVSVRYSAASKMRGWNAGALPETVGQWELVKKQMPVSFRGAPAALREAVDECAPDAVLLIGVAASRGAVTPERQGVNEMSARIPDNEGYQPQNESIVPGGPGVLFSTLPVEDMVEAIQAAGVPARLSDDAGRYVCNALLYSALYHLEQRDEPVPAAFIHVPAIPEMGLDVPVLTLEQLIAALSAAIKAI